MFKRCEVAAIEFYDAAQRAFEARVNKFPELVADAESPTEVLHWIVHSPFADWPTWMAEKSFNDARHRTEYYDSVVLVFVVFWGLLLRRHAKNAGYQAFKPATF